MPSLKAMANGASKSSKAAPSQAKTTSFLSTEKVDESDLESGTESESTSESEDEADDKLAIKPTKSNGTQERPILPQSKSIKAKAEPVNGRAASSGKAENHDETSSSEEEDEESSGSEEKSGSESADSVHEEQSPQDAAEQISKDDPPARPKQPIVAYKPPVGFEKIGANPESRNAVAQFFSAASVKGKQLWYITAPAAVPISVIKEVSLEKVQRGAPAITHNGVEYGFVADQVDETGQTRVMVPESNGKGYRLGANGIAQTLHLQQVVKLPGVQGQSLSAESGPSRATIPAKKPVRQQPEGLKMRFHPIGSRSDEPLEQSDEEMQDAPAVSPILPPTAPRPSKRKSGDTKEHKSHKSEKKKKKLRESEAVTQS